MAITGTGGDDTLNVVVVGGVITEFEGGTVVNVENVTLNLGNGIDTLSYAGTTEGVNVNLNGPGNTGFDGNFGSTVENAIGGSGNDTMTGNASDNVLNGGAGNDSLNGAGGADTLIGGAGVDTMTGGGASDTFVFLVASDSSPASPDVITDFAHSGGAQDTLDLSAIGALAFGGNNAGVLANTVTWFFDGANTIVQADVTGDAVADFRLQLNGNHPLAASHFDLTP